MQVRAAKVVFSSHQVTTLPYCKLHGAPNCLHLIYDHKALVLFQLYCQVLQHHLIYVHALILAGG